MAVTPDQPAPYAPATVILDLISRHRARGLPQPVDAGVLARASVSESLIPRTLIALKTLDLLDDSGKPTPTFEGLRLAKEDEFKPRMVEWLNATYADALQFVDPAWASETDLRDAFRNYSPTGQQTRMVTLFSGLFRAAGIGPDKPAPPPRRKTVITAYKSKPVDRQRNEAVHAHTRTNAAGYVAPATGLPPALAGLLSSLPLEGPGWTKSDRQRFLTAFEAVLDFTVPIILAPRAGDPAPEPEDFDEDADALV